MDPVQSIALALVPAFAAGFAVQRLMEVLDPFLDIPLKGKSKKTKRRSLAFVSLIAGLLIALFSGVRVLAPLDVVVLDVTDAITTGVIISAGTEGFNSILKFVGYAKDERNEAAKEKRVERLRAEQMVSLPESEQVQSQPDATGQTLS